jgi:hypothetical protein
MLAENWPADKIVEELYLSALTRYPTEPEKTELVAALNDPAEANKRSVLEDVYWSVLSSKEFLFNH